MNISEMKKISVNELKKAEYLIRNHETFAVADAVNTTEIARKIEAMVESMDMRCRVYTANRAAAMVAALISPPVGVLNAIAIGIHNLATWDPDYEIIKCLIDNQVVVVYKK